MVEIKSVPKWKCPYCDSEYDNYNDAEMCADDCNENEEPKEITEEMYVCEMCDEEFNNITDAEKCESKHKKDNDDHYNNWVDVQNKLKLANAGRHPNQTKLC